MSDIRSVLSLLCQHLHTSISVDLKPEYFRLAKFDDSDERVAQTFWSALDILSVYALRQRQVDIDVRGYEKKIAVKLRFAYLQYSPVEFYALSEGKISNRQLLLAFAWLLGTENVLNTLVRMKLNNSVLGRECSYQMTSQKEQIADDASSSLSSVNMSSEMNNILQLNGRLNYNIKQITELFVEKSKLVAKVHAASMNANGLSHLSVSEVALIKRLSDNCKNRKSKDTQNSIDALMEAANLLEIHMKWMKKEAIFFEWMVTVIDEERKSKSKKMDSINLTELTNFTFFLNREIQKKWSAVIPGTCFIDSPVCVKECTSRFLRTHTGPTEAESLLRDITERGKNETEELSRKKEEIQKELKGILSLIPACVQI